MPVPLAQMWTVASYVVGQKLRRRRRYPLVLMLEPLFRCNLACAGCGKIQYPAHILKRDLSLEDCLRAVDECGAPMVSIPGGEPLMYPEIGPLVEALVARRKYIYLCTNALLLREKLEAGLFRPSRYLTFSVHMDGQEEHHDFAVCREGTYAKAVDALRLAVEQGYRVTTNTTLFEGADPNSVRGFFDEMMDLGVEGMMVSPGYAYDKAPDQKGFLKRRETNELFEMILSTRPTTSSAGNDRATSSRRATPRRTTSFWRRRTGRPTATRAAIPSAGSAWCTAGTSRPPSITRSAHSAACGARSRPWYSMHTQARRRNGGSRKRRRSRTARCSISCSSGSRATSNAARTRRETQVLRTPACKATVVGT